MKLKIFSNDEYNEDRALAIGFTWFLTILAVFFLSMISLAIHAISDWFFNTQKEDK